MGNHPARDSQHDLHAEFEKDLQTYLAKIERWVDLSPYERYLGRLRDVLGQMFGAISVHQDDTSLYRRAAIARIGILLAFLGAAMLAPMFYDYIPLVGIYCVMNITGIALVLLRIAGRSVFVLFTVLDTVVVTFAIHLFGSLTSVVVVFYPMLATLATIFLTFFWGLLYAALSSSLYTLVVSAEYLGFLEYSPLLGHEMPIFPVYGIPMFPLVVILVAHMINYGCAFAIGVLNYELEIRRRAAQTAVHTKNEMLAVCSHDLKNLLVAIRGYSELLMLNAQDEKKEEPTYAAEIHNTSAVMLDLIRNLLDSARLEGGTIELYRSMFGYSELIRDIRKTQEPYAALRGVTLESPLPDGPITLEADYSKISQVLTNLIQNAINYTPEGGTVCVSAETDGASSVRIGVRDTGPGIEPELRKILFSPLDLARHRKRQQGRMGNSLSTGIGLSIVKAFTELHGGTVSVESTPGSGSTFIVKLPVASRAQLDLTTRE